jgi:uncharacterized protein (TIGR02147 family)
VALQSLERLKKLDLVEFKSGRWVATGKSLATQTDIPNAALKSANRQYLEKALVSLEVDPVEIRDVTGITMAIDAKKLPIAKEMIRDFRRNLARVLETGNKSAVYRLNVQLFPISKEIKS